MLNQKATAPANDGAAAGASRSYRVDGGLTQNLGGGLRARANANYFSNGDTERLYQQDVTRATQSTRSFGGNISGSWREYVLSTTMDRTDYFNTDGTNTTITTGGSLPRISVSRGEKAIGKSPIYFGVSTEYATILRSVSQNDVTLEAQDQGLSRLEVTPTLRVPFTRVPFLTLNTSVAWRGTYWSESLDTATNRQVPEALKRQYFDFNANLSGPRFMRIFNRPERKFKHVIEPTFSVKRVTGFDIFDEIVKLESSDFEYPGTTRIGYGLTNRLYAKKETSREVLIGVGEPELLQQRTGGRRRPAISERVQPAAAHQILAGSLLGPRLTERSVSVRFPDRMGPYDRVRSSRSPPMASPTPPTSRRAVAGR